MLGEVLVVDGVGKGEVRILISGQREENAGKVIWTAR